MTASRWLYSALREAILSGRLREGSQLPATRELAQLYGLARGTIVAAFEELEAEGYVEGRRGAGTFVARIQPDHLLEVGDTTVRPGGAAGRGTSAPLSALTRRLGHFPISHPGPARAFRTDLPALDLFPVDLWARLSSRLLHGITPSLLRGCPPLGHPPLREAIAGYLRASRGVRCSPEQVAMVSGAQEALDLAARLVLDPSGHVAVEDPGYVGARLVFEAAGATVLPIPVDEDGFCFDAESLRGVRLVYLTPAHQLPLGVSLSLPRRLALLQWARAAGALLFEDDYDSEFRYSGRPVPALQGLEENSRVLFAGSFSKVLFPSLRLGYLVLPRELIEPCSALLSITRRHAPVLEQAVVTELLEEGHFGRHLRRMREVYARRLGALLEHSRRDLGDLLEISEIEAGLQTVGWLAPGITARAAAESAARHGIEVTPLSSTLPWRWEREALHLGFAAVDEGEIRRGVRKLAKALGELYP